MTSEPANRYTSVAIALHWLIALLVIGQLAGGLYMHDLPKERADLKFELYQWHKSFGVTILALTLVRLGWRLTHPAPPLPATMPRWEKIAARISHFGFYVLLIVLPLIGWLVVSSSPLANSVQTYLFGVIHWPHLPFFEGVENRRDLSRNFAELHKYVAFGIIGLIALHVGAALKHQFFNRDIVLSHMLPFLKARG